MDTKTSRIQNAEKKTPRTKQRKRSSKKTHKTTKKEGRLFQELNLLISGTKSQTKYAVSGVCVWGGGLEWCVWQRVVLVGRGIILAPFAKAGGVMGCGVV